MTVSQSLLDGLTDVLSRLGTISVRKMFGGAALYCDGQVFALISDDVVYLKVDEQNRPAFEAEQCGPFVYPTKHGEQVLASYHRAPERLLDDDDDLRAWVRDAIAVGRRAAVAKTKTKRSPQTPTKKARSSA